MLNLCVIIYLTKGLVELSKKETFSIAFSEDNKKEVFFIDKIININPNLIELNSRRYKNFILYRTKDLNLEYNIDDKKFFIATDDYFSNIEYDKNKPSTEKVIFDFFYNFEEKQDFFIKLLSRASKYRYRDEYGKYIEMLQKPTQDYSIDDIVILISLLSRRLQEDNQGPITVMAEEKLRPSKILENKELSKFIRDSVVLLKSFNNMINSPEYLMLFNNYQNTLSIPLMDFADNEIEKFPIEEINMVRRPKRKKRRVVPNIHYRPNYLHRFFLKILNELNYGTTSEVIERIHEAFPQTKGISFYDFYRKGVDLTVLGLVLDLYYKYEFDDIVNIIKKIHEPEKIDYFNTVAKNFLAIEDIIEQRVEFETYISIFGKYMVSNINQHFKFNRSQKNTNFNNNNLSIVSDMHFSKDISNFNKELFSANFNIIAGDFYDYGSFSHYNHESSLDIKGVGVLGNHDVVFSADFKNIQEEIDANYKKSIETLNKYFPNIKILNNEVYYYNGFAFVGITMFVDEDEDRNRYFFIDKDWGSYFKEDYISITKRLLDSVDPNVPIILISHSPFREYSLSKNKGLGIYSNHLLEKYNNIVLYVHGHGHRYGIIKEQNNTLCVTNPIADRLHKIGGISFKWDDLRLSFKQA